MGSSGASQRSNGTGVTGTGAKSRPAHIHSPDTGSHLRKWPGRAALVAAATIITGSSPNAAELDPFDDIDRVGAYEVWTGADVAGRTWLAYSGMTHAPFGDTHADGLRLRATSGFGRYRYDYDHATKVKVEKAAADLSVGYQAEFDNATIKAFAGWAVLARDFTVTGGIDGRFSKLHHGFKLATEIWLDWSEVTWASLDAAYTDTRETVDARLRFGQRIETEVSLGLEAILNRTDLAGEVVELPGQQNYGNARIGVFVRYDWFGGEISASGGFSADVVRNRSKGVGVSSDASSPYGAMTVLLQF